MSYRVEVSPTNRAVCVVTECKKAGIKIEKGELRLGVWVTYEDRGSFKWRHWGCVTGSVLQNLRTALEDPDEEDGYNWSALDGLLDDDKNSLIHAPELQKKVKRCIKQGFIDHEDFNGDPEMNQLGEKGLHTKVTMKRKRDEAKAAAQEGSAEPASEDEKPAKPSAKKRKSAKNDDIDGNDDAEESRPAKKKRAPKAKKEEDDGEDVKPKRSRAKKVKEEDNIPDEEEQPPSAKKSRAKKAKKEEDPEAQDEEKPTSAKKARTKKVKKEVEDDEGETAEIAAPKKRAPRAKKVKEEAEADDEPVSEVKPTAKKGRKVAKKEEEPAEEFVVKEASPIVSDVEVGDAETGANDENAEEVEAEAKKRGKAKTAAKPRGPSSRTASKVKTTA